MNAVVDAGPLIALFDRGSSDRSAVLAVFERPDVELVIPALPLAEACYILASRFGPDAEIALLRFARHFSIVAPSPDDLDRMCELNEQYRDFPLGAADASIIALAERLRTPYVLTLDYRHFRAVRPLHTSSLTLLP